MNRLTEPIEQVLDRVSASWRPLVEVWRATAVGRGLIRFIATRQAAGATIYPSEVLHALALTPREAVRVVVLGQDPYHGAGQAEGLAFSVPPGIALPPSLRNIFKEQQRDLGLPMPGSGHLGPWARQGVLLLNTALTVEEGRPAAHARQGWEALTDSLITSLIDDGEPKVFMFWGKQAQAKTSLMTSSRGHCVLQSNHPSPLSATRAPLPFLGNGHFGAANRFLIAHGRAPIDWRLD
ncbi:MAG: uracil-DNA glycosylase [Pseudomonadota bacterium]